jgi:hypothetical protein
MTSVFAWPEIVTPSNATFDQWPGVTVRPVITTARNRTVATWNMTDRIAELDGLSPAVRTEPEAVSARAVALAADLVEPARVTALEKLDEGHQAHRIATDLLRSRLTVS